MAPVYIHITEDSTLNPTVDAISIVDANLQQRPVSPREKFPYVTQAPYGNVSHIGRYVVN